jgi:hypothetical protein
MKLSKTTLEKAIALSLIYSLSAPSYAVLGLINVPPQSVIPPIPNVIVTLDDSGSMGTIVPYDSTVTYAVPPNFNGQPRGDVNGQHLQQPLAFGNGFAEPQNVAGNIDNLATGAGGVPAWVMAEFAALPVAQRQNYAIWYAYYFDRNRAMKASASLSFNVNVIP